MPARVWAILDPLSPVVLPWYVAYGAAFAGVSIVTAAVGALLSAADVANILMLYLVPVLAVAVRHGSGPAIAASVLSLLAYNWFHTQPLHTFTVAKLEELVALVLFLAIAVVTSQLASSQRKKTAEARQREREARGYYEVRERLQEERMQGEVLRRTDELRTALLAAVSHDLRTPLAAIKASASSLLQADVEWTEEERRGFAQGIEQESDRLNRMVQHLLDMSRIEAGAITPDRDWYSLEALVDDTLGRLRPLTANHAVVVDVPDDLPPVPLDYVQVGQVLYNLVENAVKYTPAGTRLAVGAHHTENEVAITVTDEGPGIPAHAQERLFEAFFRVRAGDTVGVPGTGLGLAVARGLIEAHGGTISVESPHRDGRGTRFTVTLPLQPQDKTAA
jgi:two-component system sensor histidine kinase KdpD